MSGRKILGDSGQESPDSRSNTNRSRLKSGALVVDAGKISDTTLMTEIEWLAMSNLQPDR